MTTDRKLGGWCEQGWTLLELLLVVAIMGLMVGISVTPTVGAIRALRIGSDRRALVTTLALARMRASASFTRSRVYADLNGGVIRLQIWNKVASAWTTEGADNLLRTTVNFGFGSLSSPPANTQGALSQAPACLDDAGATIAGTACIVFNSRSIPIDGTGSPTANGAFWITNNSEVHGVTVSATGMAQGWSSPLAGVNVGWSKR